MHAPFHLINVGKCRVFLFFFFFLFKKKKQKQKQKREKSRSVRLCKWGRGELARCFSMHFFFRAAVQSNLAPYMLPVVVCESVVDAVAPMTFLRILPFFYFHQTPRH